MIKEKALSQKYDINFTTEDWEYFNTVRQDYLSDVLEKNLKLEKKLFTLTESPDYVEWKDLIYECNRIAHSMKGTGYSFGFKYISEVSFCIEELLDYILNNKELNNITAKKIFEKCTQFNDLIIEIVKNYFLRNNSFDTPDKFKYLLEELIDKTDQIFVIKTEANDNQVIIKKNILFIGHTNFIYKSYTKIYGNKLNQNFNFIFASGFIEGFYEIINKKISVIFCEFTLEPFNALSIYYSLKHSDNFSNLPFYFIVSDINKKLKESKISSEFIFIKDKYLINKIYEIIIK